MKKLEDTTKNRLKALKVDHKALLLIGLDSHVIPDKDFWVNHSHFVSSLNIFLNENRNWTHSLNKKDILYIICLCSSYRPREPHSILTSIAKQHPGINDPKGGN